MFTFDNLGMSDDRSLQTLLRSVERTDFCKGRMIFCVTSSLVVINRAAANIQDEMKHWAQSV